AHQPNEAYRGALLAAGALPEELVLVLPGDPLPHAFDGLLLAGGPDVHPARYGETPRTETLVCRTERDALDFAAFSAAESQGAPVFGICRGLQVLNVALGGTLWQDLPSQRPRGIDHDADERGGRDARVHAVRTAGGRSASPFASAVAAALDVNSRHHQAVKDLAGGLVSVAASPDDLVEAFERPGGAYLAAVQWHPEDLVADPRQKTLFRGFLDACRAFARAHGRATSPLVEVSLEGATAVLKLSRPASENALAGEMAELLAGMLDALGGDPTAPALVLTGAGSAFSAGFDADVLAALCAARDEAGFLALVDAAGRAVRAIVGAPRPVIAALDGPALGAGLALALACDLRIAAGGGTAEAELGPARWLSAPEAGASALLPLVAPGAAGLFLPGAAVGASRAKELGLVDLVTEDGPALPAALARAARLVVPALPALAAAKRLFAAERLAALDRALPRERGVWLALFRDGFLAASLAAAPSRPMPPQEIA
ncbi:MAG TPA: gamma-glutamyl-gamma-aminobutyrate hydrolase family protein, partial [Thermoanaerobaculia bacterium]|nr:gamma-glutamyl-gamma-aminobutyrate hydrolase family protein [Thermoanaerobaculia bacterium]